LGQVSGTVSGSSNQVWNKPPRWGELTKNLPRTQGRGRSRCQKTYSGRRKAKSSRGTRTKDTGGNSSKNQNGAENQYLGEHFRPLRVREGGDRPSGDLEKAKKKKQSTLPPPEKIVKGVTTGGRAKQKRKHGKTARGSFP